MTDYEWLTEMGLCHKCRKNKSTPDRKFCFDCLEKIKEENAKRYNPEKARDYRQRRREIYSKKKEAGICIRCTKKATHGLYCYECSIKAKRRSQQRTEKQRQERHDKGIVPEKRRETGLCRWCGKEAMKGKQCCEEHSRIFSEAGKKASRKGVKDF